MSRARTIAIGLLVLCTSTTVARAQGGITNCSRIICFVVSGGLTVPSADLADFHDSGFHYDASVLLNLPGLPIALRPEFSLTQFRLKDPLIVPAGGDDMTRMFAAMGNIELGLAGGLYLLAGGGILSLNPADLGTAGTTDSETKFTMDAGAGLRFKLGAIRGFLEARLGAASYDQGTFGFEKAQFIPFTFGLVF
jgi:hypothetical protein